MHIFMTLHSSSTAVLQVNFSQPVYEAVEGFNEVSICVVIQQGFTTSDTTVQVITTFGVTSTGKHTKNDNNNILLLLHTHSTLFIYMMCLILLIFDVFC